MLRPALPPSQGKLAPAKMTCSSRKKVTVGKFPFDVNTRKSRSRMVLQYSFGWEPINKYFGKPLRVRLFSRFSMAPQKLMTALRAGVFFKVDDSPQWLELGGWVRLDLGIPTYFPPANLISQPSHQSVTQVPMLTPTLIICFKS